MNPDPTQLSADAISKAAEAAEAVERARLAQIEQVKKEQHDAFVSALQQVLTAGEKDSAFLRLQRVPFICAKVDAIEERGKSTMTWIRGTAVTILLAIIGMAAAWGSLRNQVDTNTKNIDKLQPEAIQAAVQQGTADALKNVLLQLQKDQSTK